jgi:hypothetical protein
MSDKHSTTKHESFIQETIVGDPGHSVTKITKGNESVEARGKDAKESEARAKEKADKKGW